MKAYTVSMRNETITAEIGFCVNVGYTNSNKLNGFEIDRKDRFVCKKGLNHCYVDDISIKEAEVVEEWCFNSLDYGEDGCYVPYNAPRKVLVTCDPGDADEIKEGCIIRVCASEKQLDMLKVLHQYMRSFSYRESPLEDGLFFFSGVCKLEIDEVVDLLEQ